MNGLEPPQPNLEQHSIGSVTVGLEVGWLPTLSPEQTRVGFGGMKNEDLNKAPPQIRLTTRGFGPRGGTFSTTAGVIYLLTKRVAVTIDAFYSPLWVQEIR